MRMLWTALRMNALTLVLASALYPLAVTGVAQLVFPSRANGSLVSDETGHTVGSSLIGQGFADPAYLQPRPSAAGDKGYDATASGGSNLGPTSQKLRDRVAADLARLQRENPDAPGPVPAELVLASGSGLDPEISPEAARWQLPRIARARGVAESRLRAILDDRTEGRDLGFLGEPRVNVLELNLTLDRQFGKPASNH
jgi:K+-transporting ATPase ATPase C chain